MAHVLTARQAFTVFGNKMITLFKDRNEAGAQLAQALNDYRGQDAVILALPRGGVEVGYHVAESLAAEFSILIVRKLPFPDNPESGFGAVAEDGSVYLIPDAKRCIPGRTIERILAEQKNEIVRRIKVLRSGRPLPDLSNRQLIIVDDGIAMGSTTQAAVMCCRNAGAKRITVAAPVASREAQTALEKVADKLVILLTPPYFRAVADFYQNWHDVSDKEAITFLNMAAEAGLMPPSAGIALGMNKIKKTGLRSFPFTL